MIRDVLIITTPHDAAGFERLLGDGSQFGISISYAQQPAGRARAGVRVGADFIGDDKVALVLGDNIFYGPGLGSQLRSSATSTVAPSSPTGSPSPARTAWSSSTTAARRISLEEKPALPKSNYAVPGLYFYDNDVITIARDLEPSPRGEYEITDVNKHYLAAGRLQVGCPAPRHRLAGHRHLRVAQRREQLRPDVESRQGLKVGSPEEAAWRQGFLSDDELQSRATAWPSRGYGTYLLDLLRRGRG